MPLSSTTFFWFKGMNMFKDKGDRKGFHLNRDGNTTFIGVGTMLQGDIKCHSLRVDGSIVGSIESDGDIQVANTGNVTGTVIRGKNIIIHGVVKANIIAEGFLRIHSKANVEGDVHAFALDIEAGATFVGYSHTGDTQSIKTLAMPATQTLEHDVKKPENVSESHAEGATT